MISFAQQRSKEKNIEVLQDRALINEALKIRLIIESTNIAGFF